MKYSISIIFIAMMSVSSSAQTLGFSSFGPLPGKAENSRSRIYYNLGETIINTSEDGKLRFNNGLLQSPNYNQSETFEAQVQFYFDENGNGVKDDLDRYVRQGSFLLDNDQYRLHSEEGVSFIGEAGTYQFIFEDAGAEDWSLSSEESVSVTIDDNNQYALVEFGLSPDVSLSCVQPYIASGNFRCCTNRTYTLSAINQGTVIDDQTVWLQVDPRIGEVIYNTAPDMVIDSNYVGWNVSLYPSEKVDFNFSLKVPCIDDDITVGELFKTIAWVDNGVDRKEFCYEQELRCAYDPNDKLVNPNRPDSLALLGQQLTYTLRFQNTGNDYAENVVVTDTLSELLDLSTFKILDTSHPDVLTVENNKDNPYIIDFRFDNIFLLDSTTNEEASNGHVMFSISPIDGLDIGTEINNTGFIYFDFNPAVVTNTTGTTYVDMFPTVSTDNQEILTFTKVYPNPADGIFYIDTDINSIKAYTIEGRLIREVYNSSSIDLSGNPAGNYILKITKGELVQYEKIILSHTQN